MPKLRDGCYEPKIAEELRQLTERTRQLREELRAMLASETSGDPLKRHRADREATSRAPQKQHQPERRAGKTPNRTTKTRPR
jgi:hypothetical protein